MTVVWTARIFRRLAMKGEEAAQRYTTFILRNDPFIKKKSNATEKGHWVVLLRESAWQR